MHANFINAVLEKDTWSNCW